MNATLVTDPETIHRQWTQFYQNIGLAQNFAVPSPTFTEETARKMLDREVPRIPMPNNIRIGRTYILDLTTVSSSGGLDLTPNGSKILKISTGTWGTLQRLRRVPNALDSETWVFVEASERAPYADLLQDGWTAEDVLAAEEAVGLSYEDYAIFMLYRRKVLGLDPGDSATTLLLGSESNRSTRESRTKKAVVWGYFHGQEGLVVSDNDCGWLIGLGIWTKIAA